MDLTITINQKVAMARTVGVFRCEGVPLSEAASWLEDCPGVVFLADIDNREDHISAVLYWLEIKCPCCGDYFLANRDRWKALEGNLQFLYYDPEAKNECSFINAEDALAVKNSIGVHEFIKHYCIKNDLDCSRVTIVFKGMISALREQPVEPLFSCDDIDVLNLNPEDNAVFLEMEQVQCQLPTSADDENVLSLNGFVSSIQRCPHCNNEIQIIAGHEELAFLDDSLPYQELRDQYLQWPHHPLTVTTDAHHLDLAFDLNGANHQLTFLFKSGYIELDGLKLFRNTRKDEEVFRASAYEYAPADDRLFDADCGILIGNYLESLIKQPSFFDDEEIYRQLQACFPDELEMPPYRQDGMNFLNLVLHHRFRRYPSDFYDQLRYAEHQPVCCYYLIGDGDEIHPESTLFDCSELPLRYEDLLRYYDELGLPVDTSIRTMLINDPLKLVTHSQYDDLPFKESKVLACFLSLPNYRRMLHDFSTRGISFAPLRLIGKMKGEEHLLNYLKNSKSIVAHCFSNLEIFPFQHAIDDPESILEELQDYLLRTELPELFRSMPLMEYGLVHGQDSFTKPFRYTHAQRQLEQVINGYSFELAKNPFEISEASKILERDITRNLNYIPERELLMLTKKYDAICGAVELDHYMAVFMKPRYPFTKEKYDSDVAYSAWLESCQSIINSL